MGMLSIKNKLPKTAVELFEQLPEGLLCQVIDNTIYISPAPEFIHQVICQVLSSQYLPM
jgi:hypothetical protein